jgi:hypothetical protein
MNTIYGANNKKTFIELQALNTGKSKLNFSMFLMGNESFEVYKVHVLAKNYKFPRKKYNTFFGITEPKTKEFSPDYMSPIITDEWFVACCGDITNRKELMNEVEGDTVSLIVSDLLVAISKNSKKNDVKLISETLSYLQGNYSMWIHNAVTRNSFIVKCNADLYVDIYENTFSSVKFDKSSELQDGEIYQLTREGITNVGSFECPIC